MGCARRPQQFCRRTRRDRPKLDERSYQSALYAFREELRAAIRLDALDRERHLFGDAIQEEQGVARVSPRVDPQNAKARAIIDRRVLIHAWRDLHRVHLHAIAWDRPAVVVRHVTALGPDQRFDLRRRQNLVDGRQREFSLFEQPQLSLDSAGTVALAA
jgi:hypothetical protein